MKIVDRVLLGIVIVFGLFAMHQLVAGFVSVHKWPQLTASDWGTWAGSVGTVATLVGTIRIATASARKQEREQLDLAIIAAASMATWISDLRQGIWVAGQKLPGTLDAPDNPRDALLDCAASIDHIGVWTREDLTPLIHLPNHAGARLAAVGVQIRSGLAAFKRTAEKTTLYTEIVVAAHSIFISYFQAYSDQLEALEKECIAFLKAHGFDTGSDE